MLSLPAEKWSCRQTVFQVVLPDKVWLKEIAYKLNLCWLKQQKVLADFLVWLGFELFFFFPSQKFRHFQN